MFEITKTGTEYKQLVKSFLQYTLCYQITNCREILYHSGDETVFFSEWGQFAWNYWCIICIITRMLHVEKIEFEISFIITFPSIHVYGLNANSLEKSGGNVTRNLLIHHEGSTLRFIIPQVKILDSGWSRAMDWSSCFPHSFKRQAAILNSHGLFD